MAAPTLTAQAEVSGTTTTTPKTCPISGTVNVSAGDVVYAWQTAENGNTTFTTAPSKASGTATIGTFTSLSEIGSGGTTGRTKLWKATVTGSGTLALSLVRTGSALHWDGGLVVATGVTAEGTPATINGTFGAANWTLTTAAANSSILVIGDDFQPSSGARTYEVINGNSPTVLSTLLDGANYGTFGGYWTDAGAAGAKTVGLSAPSDMAPYGIAIELQGSSTPTFSDVASASFHLMTAAAGQKTGQATAAAGERLATATAGQKTGKAAAIASLAFQTAATGSKAATTYPSAVLADTPVAYWRMGAASGAEPDQTGHGHSLTVNGGTRDIAGALSVGDDGAAQFSGTGTDYAEASLDLSAANVVTLEAWLWWDAYDSSSDDLFAEFNGPWGPTLGSFIVDMDNSTGGVEASTVSIGYHTGSLGVVRGTFPQSALSAAAWHHVVFVFNSGAFSTDTTNFGLKAYIDGAPVTLTLREAVDGGGNFGSAFLRLMARGASSLNGAGRLDEVAIYAGELTSDRVATHYAAASGRGPSASATATFKLATAAIGGQTSALASSASTHLATAAAGAKTGLSSHDESSIELPFTTQVPGAADRVALKTGVTGVRGNVAAAAFHLATTVTGRKTGKAPAAAGGRAATAAGAGVKTGQAAGIAGTRTATAATGLKRGSGNSAATTTTTTAAAGLKGASAAASAAMRTATTVVGDLGISVSSPASASVTFTTAATGGGKRVSGPASATVRAGATAQGGIDTAGILSAAEFRIAITAQGVKTGVAPASARGRFATTVVGDGPINASSPAAGTVRLIATSLGVKSTTAPAASVLHFNATGFGPPPLPALRLPLTILPDRPDTRLVPV